MTPPPPTYTRQLNRQLALLFSDPPTTTYTPHDELPHPTCTPAIVNEKKTHAGEVKWGGFFAAESASGVEKQSLDQSSSLE